MQTDMSREMWNLFLWGLCREIIPCIVLRTKIPIRKNLRLTKANKTCYL